MKYYKNVDFDLIETLSEAEAFAVQSMLKWQPFENDPIFCQNRPINHTKNSKCPPIAKIISNLEDIISSTICITRAMVLGLFLYLTVKKLPVGP